MKMIPRSLVLSPLALVLAACAAWAMPRAQGPAEKPGSDPWMLGARLAVRAYTKASDAYAANVLGSVALWSLLIAAALVLLEWLLGRRRGPHAD